MSIRTLLSGLLWFIGLVPGSAMLALAYADGAPAAQGPLAATWIIGFCGLASVVGR